MNKIPRVPKRAKPVSIKESLIDTITDVDKLKAVATKPDNATLVMQAAIKQTEATLVVKGIEYTRNNDRLHAFREAANIKHCTMERACDDMAMKHYVSYRDMLNDIDKGIVPTEVYVQEKLGDLRNYLFLMEAVIMERINKKS